MKISAALAADLGILTAALDEPAADVLHSLHRLGVDARAAVPTFLGLSVTVAGGDPPFTCTTFEEGAADNVRTSLWLTLPAGVGEGRAGPSVALVFFAARPGTFVDLAADLAWLTGRPPSDFALDQHLSVPAGSDGGASLRAASVINQAIGVLIGRGCTPRQAHSKLDTQADGARTDRYTTAQSILDTLTAADPADAERRSRTQHGLTA
ncbi:MAG TPA: hypothetical protein VGH54_00555 [Mycobacterium sp.]|jgi:hypothetical protein|uniref:hypothetical protein n=1 Tax=Mycobacterium sp. TaxID=1785 RepID=UPI002F41D470